MMVRPSTKSGPVGSLAWADSPEGLSSRAGGTISSCCANSRGAVNNRAVHRARLYFWFIRIGFDFLGTDENGQFFRNNKISGQKAFGSGIPPLNHNVKLSPILPQFRAGSCPRDSPTWPRPRWRHN